MRIISGRMKGKILPFVNAKYGNAEITSQMVKEAYFDIISPIIRGASFLDLFGCSGQIGLEAYSRGALRVQINEIDRQRLKFILDCKKNFSLPDELSVSSLDAFRLIKQTKEGSEPFDIIYCDPPYEKKEGAAGIYRDLLEAFSKSAIASENAVITFQHYVKNSIPQKHGIFELYDSRTYGQNSLGFYRRINESRIGDIENSED